MMLLAAEPFRVQLELGTGIAKGPLAQLGGGLELDYYPLPQLRLHASGGASWISSTPDTGDRSGALRLLAGADGVLPFRYGELFMGVESGFVYSNAEDPRSCSLCLRRYGVPWEMVPAMRARAGVELGFLWPLVLGLDAGYELFSRDRSVHWAELHARLG